MNEKDDGQQDDFRKYFPQDPNEANRQGGRDDFRQYLPEEEEGDRRIEVPAALPPPPIERIPNAFTPMGEIGARGVANRNLAGGRLPWWVLISGWVMFGGTFLMVLVPVVLAGRFELLPALMISLIPVLILWRGTTAKLAMRRTRRR